MRSKFYSLRLRVIELRKSGKTYGEILKIIKKPIAKSTLSDWCHNLHLTKEEERKINQAAQKNSTKGLQIALAVNKAKREKYLDSIINRNISLSKILRDKDSAKVVLSILYLAEGAKSLSRGALYFGNSDPFVIDLFLSLIRKCYNIDESKFRCTVLCRADQDVVSLENFWFKITKIPKYQFYKTRIDPRTIGRPSKNLNYKGVCKIDYFSADVFLDLMSIPKIIHKGP